MIARFLALLLILALAACSDGGSMPMLREQAYTRSLGQVYAALSRDHVTAIDLAAFSKAGYEAVGLPPPATDSLTQGQALGQDLAARTPASSPNKAEALEIFIEAGLEATTDSVRFTQYLNPAEYQGFLGAVRGKAGIGVRLVPAEEGLRIAAIRPESPAERAGLRTGTVILAVDGQPLAQVDEFEAQLYLLSGRAGTPIDLDVSSIDGLRRLRLVRERQSLNDFNPSRRIGNLGLIPLDIFDEGASNHVRSAFQGLTADGPLAGLILNLRDNSGGNVFEALAIADLFVDAETPIFRYETRHGNRVIRAHHPVFIPPGLPVAVLINGSSASASEILAGALLDARRAVVIGSGSFGKGTQQEVRPLSNGGALALTNAFIFRADGRAISFRGIIPHICTARTGNPNQVVAALRRGGQPTLVQQASRARFSSQARRLCPAQEGSETSDLALAGAILTNLAAYRRALGL